ncbi:MAG: histidine phosphatase family protein [Nostocoides sp.]
MTTPSADPQEPSEERTVVHLVRHGEVHNPGKVLYGRLPDFHLSQRGRAMADIVAAYLSDHDVTAVISSPLERAQETAAPIAAARHLAVTLDDGLIEATNKLQGRPVAGGQGLLKDPRVLRHLVNPFRPSWGEAYTDIARRMQAALTAGREAGRGHEAVLVSHQLPIWTARQAAVGKRLWHDPRSRECGLASVTSFTYAGDRLLDVDYAEPAASLYTGSTGGVGA